MEEGSLWFRGDCKQVWAGNEKMSEEIATSNDLILRCQYMGSIRNQDEKLFKSLISDIRVVYKTVFGNVLKVIAAEIKSVFLGTVTGV